jgi:hypothetical protein
MANLDSYFLAGDGKTCVLTQKTCIFFEDEGCSFCDTCYLPEEYDEDDTDENGVMKNW